MGRSESTVFIAFGPPVPFCLIFEELLPLFAFGHSTLFPPLLRYPQFWISLTKSFGIWWESQKVGSYLRNYGSMNFNEIIVDFLLECMYTLREIPPVHFYSLLNPPSPPPPGKHTFWMDHISVMEFFFTFIYVI